MSKLNRIELKIWDDKSEELIFHFIGTLEDFWRVYSNHNLPGVITRAQEEFNNFQETQRFINEGSIRSV